MHTLFALLATVTSLAVTAPSQQQPLRSAPDPLSVSQRASGVHYLDGELLATGTGYKARFMAGAVEFTPALGAAVPHNLPVRLALESIRRGGTSVWQGPSQAAPTLLDQSVLYHHENGIVERYDVGPSGLKQSFVFATRPSGSGDLVVRLRLDTELSAVGGQSLDELRFAAAEVGGVTVAGVTGIDAEDHRIDGHMNFDGSWLELVLPADYVEHASYPLVLDPLIGSYFRASMFALYEKYKPDVAYDVTNDVYLVVYTTEYSAADSDIEAQLIDGSGSLVGSAMTIATSPSFREEASAVANLNLRDRFFVVWQENSSGNWNIQGRPVAAATGTPEPILASIASSAANEVEPDIGGDQTLVGDSVMVVYRDATSQRIRSVQVRVSAAGNSGVVLGQDLSSSFFDMGAPRISQTGGAARRFIVAAPLRNGAGPYNDLMGMRALSADSALLSGFVGIGVADATACDVAGDGDRFLVAYQQGESPGSANHDIWAVALVVSASPGPNANLGVPGQFAHAAAPGVDEHDPAVACILAGGPGSAARFTVCWAEPDGVTPGVHVIQAQNIDERARSCGSRFALGQANEDNIRPAITTEYTGGASSTDLGLIVYRTFLSPVSRYAIDAQRWEAFGGGPVTQILPGCGHSGTLSAGGPFAVGNPSFSIGLSGADPNAILAILLVDALGSPTTSCGTCTMIGATFTRFALINGGSTEVALTLPCDPGFLGVQMDMQWLTYNPVGGVPCVLVPGMEFSTAARMVLGN